MQKVIINSAHLKKSDDCGVIGFNPILNNSHTIDHCGKLAEIYIHGMKERAQMLEFLVATEIEKTGETKEELIANTVIVIEGDKSSYWSRRPDFPLSILIDGLTTRQSI
jgi:hypothetical protein